MDVGTRVVLTLGDLLGERSLGLELLTGPVDAAERAVRGAAVVEVPSPGRWIAREWVLLTAGVRLPGAAEDTFRALAAECDAAGVAALGWGIGPVFDEPPAALLDEARARGLAMFAVPRQTAFRDVVRFVDTAIMGAEGSLFRRLSSLQRFVADALREPEPEPALIERLARFMDASAAVLGAGGAAEITRGKAPVDALWQTVAGRPPAIVATSAEGWRAVAAPLAAQPGEAPRWLLLAGPEARFNETLAKRAAEVVAPLLVAMEELKAVAHEQELAVRGALLDEALSPGGSDVASLSARAAAFGLDFSEPARVLLLRSRSGAAVVRHELDEALARAAQPSLVSERDGAVVALVQGDAPHRMLHELPATVLVGLGRAIGGIGQARDSLRDAELALQKAAPEPGRAVVTFEQFDLGTLLLSDASPERLAPKVEAILSVLRANPPLHEALIAYFEHDLDVGATAGQLHLHPNSLRYRLARIEELLGCSLKHPATIAELHIALLADPQARDPRF